MLASEHAKTPPRHAFDSLTYAKNRESVGFTRQQAEMLAQEQAKLIDERLATKLDVEMVRADIEHFKTESKRDVEQLRLFTESSTRESELRMTVRLRGMIVALVGLFIAVKYFG